MKLYELKITILLKTDIELANANQTLAKAINFILTQNEYTRELHCKNGLKSYVFSLPYPIDIQTKIYQKDRVYLFSIRSIDEKFINTFKENLKKVNLDECSILASELKIINQFKIKNIETITPTILTITEDEKTRNWTKKDKDLNFVIERFQNNLEKKYKQFFAEELKSNNYFIDGFSILNKKPILAKYKNNSILGNKFKLYIRDDEISQKLAFLALGVGLAEKNSLGFGYCKANGGE